MTRSNKINFPLQRFQNHAKLLLNLKNRSNRVIRLLSFYTEQLEKFYTKQLKKFFTNDRYKSCPSYLHSPRDLSAKGGSFFQLLAV